MKEELVSFELAKLANDKGFDEAECIGYFDIDEGYKLGYAFCYSDTSTQSKDGILAPSQSLLQRWLRENHNIIISVNYNHDIKQFCSSWEDTYFYKFPYDWYDTYEEALEEGLKEALKSIK